MTKKTLASIALASISFITAANAAICYNLNVELVQVCSDDGFTCTATGPAGGMVDAYYYMTQVQDIWAQAGIQVNFMTSTWDESDALQLTSAERSSLYAGTFPGAPATPVDTLQMFFVQDHPGTGYTGAAGTGWLANPLANPALSARNAGNAQLGIVGFTSLGRGVMANEGFTSDKLSRTLAHEIGHALGLRHVNDPGTPQPGETLPLTSRNLMWAAGAGDPPFDPTLDNFPAISNLQENAPLTAYQIGLAISNGLALDPDGNGTGVLTQIIKIPEPSRAVLIAIGLVAMISRRRRG